MDDEHQSPMVKIENNVHLPISPSFLPSTHHIFVDFSDHPLRTNIINMSAFIQPIPISSRCTSSSIAVSSSCASSFLRSTVFNRSTRPSHLIEPTTYSPLVMTVEPPAIMVNGIPGRMATATAEEVLSRGFTLVDEALTGPAMQQSVQVASTTVKLSPPDDHVACLQRVKAKYPNLVLVDYTHPSAANPNVEKYVAEQLSFVIGTTGGDADKMKTAVNSADGVYAVIAPNMGKQIVAFQAMMKLMSTTFPGAFAGYSMTVKESHQATKADTSGTAKSVVASFQDLGIPFSTDEIELVRDEQRSINEMHVPPEYVKAGHAFHTYTLTSPDQSVQFQFQHNVCGRSVYAAGTVDAALFLNSKRNENASKRVFHMIDILQSGQML